MTDAFTLERLQGFLDRFPRLQIGLVGDLFLDRYLEIDAAATELSLETGLEAYQVSRVRNSPGALGTVLNNLAALGVGQLVPVTVIGDDGHGFDLVKSLSTLPVDTDHILRCPRRRTPTYTKPLLSQPDGSWRELNRLDIRTRGPLVAETSAAVCAHLERVFAACDGLIVLDQVNETDWGVVNDAVGRRVAELAAAAPGKLIFVDSRRHLSRFRCGVVKGNQYEIAAATGQQEAESPSAAVQAAVGLARRNRHPVYCTQGERGIVVAFPDGRYRCVPGFAVSGPIDIVGAGDSATSGLVAALLSGAQHGEAAILANLVASITVQQLGTTGTATPDQVRQRWTEVTGGRGFWSSDHEGEL